MSEKIKRNTFVVKNCGLKKTSLAQSDFSGAA
jgi:hypothetical protein